MPTSQQDRHQKHSLSEALKEARGSKKSVGGIQKEVSALKASPSDGEFGSGIMAPSAEQLEKINRFTRTPKSADEVVVFATLSCNDLVDRDDDQFTTECVKDFAALEGDLSPVGKSYMVSHDYTKLPVGRIFDASTQEVEKATFLRNEVYMPNTQQNKDFIENVDFGIYWAVSVGVMLGKDACSICDEPMFSFFGFTFCENGHDKGVYYDPRSDEEDEDGWPIPVPPEQAGATKCVRKMMEPRDFYELSQVFLGAQYFASLEKDPAFSGIIKAAGAKKLPVIGLSRQEAKKLPIPHQPEKVTEAVLNFEVKEHDNGVKSWTDEDGLVWEFEPNSDELLCLGKSEDIKQEDEDGSGTIDNDTGTGDEGDQGDSRGESSGTPGEAGEGQVSSEDSEASSSEEPEGSSVDDEPEEPKESEEEEMDKSAVLALLKQVKMPTSIVEQVAVAEAGELTIALQLAADEIEKLEAERKTLASKAELGEAYVKSLRAEAIDSYVKANKDPSSQQGVNTTNVEKLLDACGDNIELIKELCSQYMATAQAKFPGTVRRSSFEVNPNVPFDLPEVGSENIDTKSVRKLHG